MYKIYIALDYSMSFVMHSSTNTYTETKFKRALEFICQFVKEMIASDLDINLIEFSNDPKIVKRSVQTKDDVIKNFPISTVKTGKPDFLQLRDIILKENILNNFELILLLEASHYQHIPILNFPGIVRLLLFSDSSNSFYANKTFELHSNSLKFCFVDEGSPYIICKDCDVTLTLNKITKSLQLKNEIIIVLSDSLKTKVNLYPGSSRLPISSYDGRVLQAINKQSDIQLFKLIGFTKNANLFNVASSVFVQIVKPSDHETENFNTFHSLAEMLGAEGMVAILQHEETAEEYALKPYRNDGTKLWVLCLQLIPSTAYKWEKLNMQSQQNIKNVRFPQISYKSFAVTPRIHWIDQHGIQADIQKLHRLLKRTDRIEQFYQEIQRIASFAISFGYQSFAPEFANIIQSRCENIPTDCKAHLSRVVNLLRKGGFKMVCETKLIM